MDPREGFPRYATASPPYNRIKDHEERQWPPPPTKPAPKTAVAEAHVQHAPNPHKRPWEDMESAEDQEQRSAEPIAPVEPEADGTKKKRSSAKTETVGGSVETEQDGDGKRKRKKK